MKQIYLTVCALMCCLLCCTPAEEKKPLNQTKIRLDKLKATFEKQGKTADPALSMQLWKKKLQDPIYKEDAVLLSKIHYLLAGTFYNLNKLDSVKVHMQLAWELMEKQQGYEEEKVLMYSGLGNVANAEQKINQANYYYNQAAQMLLADSSLDLAAKAKINIYLSAAQSCDQLRQFDHAFNLNRQAIALLPRLKDNERYQFRAYSQMANCYSRVKGKTDSLYAYIEKMEKMYTANPDASKARFLMDRKAVYFMRENQNDSAIFYNRKILAMDQLEEQELQDMASSVISGNLYNSYAGLAGSFLASGKLDSAKHYLLQCEKFEARYPGKADENNFISYRQNLIAYLFASKDYRGAEAQQNLLIGEYKSLYENENSRAVAEMATVYQLVAKDKSIHSLSETVGLTQSQLQTNKLWLLITTLAALLSISIILLLFYFQKQRQFKSEKATAQLEQRLLRTQMEPHFIFNTLSALQSFVRFDEKEKTLKYLNQFSRLLRSSLELSRQSQVPLNEEIETLENYLSLQQMRYDDAFSYQVVLPADEDPESVYIPPMLIQPFVENAIIHGLDPGKKNGRISVSFGLSGNLLKVIIADNGKGIVEHKSEQVHQSLSTAISKERLQILAKESGLPAGIRINSRPQKGTQVEILIPVTSAH